MNLCYSEALRIFEATRMPKNLDEIRAVLRAHYDETQDGLVEKAPSRLTRGEGTRKSYYILKIDLVNSTLMLQGRRAETYLRYAHTFLSTIDRITQMFGADREQVEYAGDSVLAYFPESVPAFDVVAAACFAKVAVEQMRTLDRTMGSFAWACKIVIHFDSLIVARIGPRSASFVTAIGYPLHRVAKLEKTIVSGTGRATPEFYRRVDQPQRRYLSPVYSANQAATPAAVSTLHTQPNPTPNLARLTGLTVQTPPPPNLLTTLLTGSSFPSSLRASGLLLPTSSSTPPVPPPEIIGYDLKWDVLFQILQLR